MGKQNIIGIAGSGMVGASMALLFTGNGYPTVMHAVDQENSQAGLLRYRGYLEDLVGQGLMDQELAEICQSYLTVTTDYGDMAEAEFVFECVTERLEIKHAVYREIEKHCSKLRCLASSTSALSPEELAEGFGPREKMLVAHPWNPPHLVPCVELVGNSQTSGEAVRYAKELFGDLGREVVVLNRAVKGFIGNRLQYAMLREAIFLAEQGVASPEDIDRAVKYSFAPRYTSIGLFEHFDNCGLDLTEQISGYLYQELCDAKTVQTMIAEHCKNGETGLKSGKGIYDWTKRDVREFIQRTEEPYLGFFNWKLPKDVCMKN